MDPARWARIEAVFAEAVEAGPGRRDEVLDRACGDDDGLRREVEALLAEHDAEPDFLERPPPWRAHEAATAGAGHGGGSGAPAPERIGPYRILRPLGRGGMGTVYLAERRARDFTRTVALKVVRRGLDTDDVLARFRAERQILATLDHPNIARLLEVGSTDDGLPYFVLEYVDGRPLDVHCREAGLGLEERLRLVLTVCRAVHHAHQRLVVHRDLKPSNILVTADGTPKLLDFGISKLLLPAGEGEGTPPVPALTRVGQRVLTPEYAAPEQVRGEAVSTSTDVYALGVLLYELVTGGHPLAGVGSGGRTRPESRAEWERAVRERRPLPPSRAERLRREAGEETPVGRLPAELDTLVLTAMRKDPAERYSSAVSLAEDVQRFLAGRPLRARPSTLLYRARKFVRRNPVGVGTAALVAVLLVGATALTLHQSRRIQEEAERVARERDKALRVRGFLLEMFGATGPGGAPGDTVTARGLLDRRAAALDREWGHDREMQAEMMTVLAEGYERLGLWDEAEPLAREALAVRRDLLGEDHPDVAASLNVLGWLLHEQGRLQEAETHLRDAVDRGREAFGPEGEPGGDARLARALNDLGVVREARGDYEEAAALYRESLDMRRRLEGEAAPGVAITASNLSVVLYRRGELEAAVAAAREALELFRRSFGPDHRRTTIVQSNLAAMQSYRGDHAGAEAEHREILERRRRLHGPDHPQVAFSMTMLAHELVAQDRAAEAEPLLREALEIQREALGPDHPNVGTTLRVLADVLLQEARPADALAVVNEALEVAGRRLGPGHEEVAALRARRARVLEALGREGEAEAEWRASLRISTRALGPHHLRTADVALSLARHLLRRGGGPEVVELADRVEAAVTASDAPADHAVVQGLARLREAVDSGG